MYKIAIVTRKMITGGIEKALISMLEALPTKDIEVTLFVMATGGEFEKYIPQNIIVKNVFGDEISCKVKLKKNFESNQFKSAIKKNYYLIKSIISRSGYKQAEYILKTFPENKEKYDLAIAYHTPASFPVIYVSKYLNAKKKVAWIHSDIEIYKKELKKYIKYYENFDKIYCVSKYALDKFNKHYPKLSDKTEVFLNIINRKELEKLSEQGDGFNDNYEGIRILTVGRMTEEKGHDILPKIILKILKENIDVKWYCIGDGELRKSLEKQIISNKLEKRLILLGSKDNPYPYFKTCDIYVQPSRHEGYCITLAEAKILNKPIVTTDFIGAREQIIDNKNGLIVKFDCNEIATSIIKLCKDKSLGEAFADNLKKYNKNENISTEKLKSLIS